MTTTTTATTTKKTITPKKPTATTTVGVVVAVSARRAAAFELARDRLNTEATDAAITRQLKKQQQQTNKNKRKAAAEPQEEEEDSARVHLDKFVRAHAYKLAAYEGQLPRPLPCEDSDDDALAAEREDAFGAHLVERSYERDRRRAALRRLSVDYARRALPRRSWGRCRGMAPASKAPDAASKVARARHVRARTRQTSGCSWPPTVTAVPET